MSSPQTEAPTLLLRQEGGRLFVTFNRPERRNALNDVMLLELEQLITRLEEDASVRAVIFRGAGGHFCAGGDIRERRQQTTASRPGVDIAMERNIRAGRMFLRLANLPQTTVCVVEGYALGGGFGFACTFDICLVMHDVQIGMAETRIGVAPAQIAPQVVRRVGLSNARYLGLTGRRLNGEEAVRLGVAHDVACSAEELDQKLARLLDDIDACGPQACAATKAIMNRVGEIPLDALIEYAGRRFGELNRGPEGIEGQQAFLEKRKPRWPSLTG
ncbi:enoyl-CoA hydratase/isomerase family protein [Algiphilus sp. W345]|uniref:Enoyl-CoA hydratase/isomerase family protein n=1 Tax=Banduia mediterranea TaxID=3075609 RepID=A0ABU2WFV6_9GAMM|nr:enoyl-CoA hydratase/isomerase family protein [Algiphilus sp. W345]MDT0496393.1 enoyl-CoA hydratase/isomerase family protein [Algiphilus sp. W345]